MGAAKARCCWGPSCGSPYSCAPASGWCAESHEQCTASCNGLWCPVSPVAGIESSQKRRHGRLRAHRLQLGSDNVMLQKLRKFTRSASAETGIRDVSSKHEL